MAKQSTKPMVGQPTEPAPLANPAMSIAEFAAQHPTVTIKDIVKEYNRVNPPTIYRTPTPTMASDSKAKSLIKEPLMFNGNKNAYREWKRKLMVYLHDLKNRIVNNQERINIALSYMDGPAINDWIQVFYENHFNYNHIVEVECWDLNWKAFQHELDKTFLDIR